MIRLQCGRIFEIIFNLEQMSKTWDSAESKVRTRHFKFWADIMNILLQYWQY